MLVVVCKVESILAGSSEKRHSPRSSGLVAVDEPITLETFLPLPTDAQNFTNNACHDPQVTASNNQWLDVSLALLKDPRAGWKDAWEP